MNEQLERSNERELALLNSLQQLGVEIEADSIRVEGAYIVKFPFDGGATTIRVSLRDQSGADLVITNMTTLPVERKREGLGTRAVQKLLEAAKSLGFRNIRAVQVGEENESFWTRNGFVKDEGPNPTSDFVLRTPDNDE